MNVSERQKKYLASIRAKGKTTPKHSREFFSSKHAQDVLQHFVAKNIIIPNTNWYDYNKDMDEEILEILKK